MPLSSLAKPVVGCDQINTNQFTATLVAMRNLVLLLFPKSAFYRNLHFPDINALNSTGKSSFLCRARTICRGSGFPPSI